MSKTYKYGSKEFKENLKKKYGDENYNNREKAKQTCLEKYGVDHNFKLFNASEHSKQIWNEQGDKIREKIKNTSLEKYGTESPNQNEEVKNKQKEGLINHYGSLEAAIKHKNEISKQTKLEKYGDENYHNVEKFSKTLLERHLKFETEHNCLQYNKVIKLYGQGWKSLNLPIIYNGRFRYISNEYIPQIKQYSEEQHNLQSESKLELELYKYIKSLTKNRIYQHNKNIIKDDNQKYELDIYIPKLNLAFEFNGIYWHSNLYIDKYYHQLKTKLCYEKGIQLVHIYENDWIINKDIIKQHIKELLEGIDCSCYNWISVNDYDNYVLSEPEEINIGRFTIFNEGKFIKKNNLTI